METYAIVLVLVSLLSGFISILNIIVPIKAIGFANRGRAAHLFALSFLWLAIGVIIAGISAPGNSQADSLWGWPLSFVAVYGLFRFVRSGRKKEKSKSAREPIADTSTPDPQVRVPPRYEPASDASTIGSPLATQDTTGWSHRPRKSAARWIPLGETATVAGRKIGGMIYLGSQPHTDSWKREGNPFIDPGQPVARIGVDFSDDGMPYWPSFSDLNPRTRATYLDWLAGGRTDKRIGPGYVFLYFYGLERRFFVDTPANEERRLIVFEATRLLDAYGENHSVRRYLGTFLDAAHILLGPTGKAEPRLEKVGYELPLGLRAAIGLMAKAGQPLSADWLLSWFLAHPETSLRTPATRAFPEFKALFKMFFDERHPNGLKMRTPKRILRARYMAASGAFEVDLNRFLGEVPDISGLSRQLNVAKALADEATDALGKYGRFLGRNPEGRNSIEAHALLPECLWPLFPCAEMEDLRRWAEGIIEGGGLSPIEHVVERLEGVRPEKIGKRQLTGAADALARLSIGMAPDPRFALRSPKLGEPVVLFRLPVGITALEEVSEKYRSILVAIAMGSFIAHADGTIAADERRALEARIGAAELPEPECARLLANLQWMLAIPPDLSLFRRRLKDAPESTRHELGQVALAMAGTDQNAAIHLYTHERACPEARSARGRGCPMTRGRGSARGLVQCRRGRTAEQREPVVDPLSGQALVSAGPLVPSPAPGAQIEPGTEQVEKALSGALVDVEIGA